VHISPTQRHWSPPVGLLRSVWLFNLGAERFRNWTVAEPEVTVKTRDGLDDQVTIWQGLNPSEITRGNPIEQSDTGPGGRPHASGRRARSSPGKRSRFRCGQLTRMRTPKPSKPKGSRHRITRAPRLHGRNRRGQPRVSAVKILDGSPPESAAWTWPGALRARVAEHRRRRHRQRCGSPRRVHAR